MFDRFEHRHLEHRGVTLHARVGGSGPPLLLLHGHPQTHVMWHRVAESLRDAFSVVAIDLRGYGDSSRPPSDATHLAYSKRVMAEDAVAVMRELGHPRFALCAHDRGARDCGHYIAEEAPAELLREMRAFFDR